MTRDNVLYVVIGVLTGFVAGYMLHEAMAARQPPRRLAGAAEAGPATAASAPGAGPQAAMEQVQQLRAYVDEHPDDQEAVLLLANLNYDIRNWNRAAALYEQYLKLDQDNVDVMTDLGVTYRSLGQADKALELFRKVRGIAPDHWRARFNEVVVLAFDLGDLKRAKAALGELQALQPDNPDVERLASEVDRRLAGA